MSEHVERDIDTHELVLRLEHLLVESRERAKNAEAERDAALDREAGASDALDEMRADRDRLYDALSFYAERVTDGIRAREALNRKEPT